jgi:hypothetical protein
MADKTPTEEIVKTAELVKKVKKQQEQKATGMAIIEAARKKIRARSQFNPKLQSPTGSVKFSF